MSKTFKQIKTELAAEKKKVQQSLSSIKQLAKMVTIHRKKSAKYYGQNEELMEKNKELEQKLLLTEALLKTKL